MIKGNLLSRRGSLGKKGPLKASAAIVENVTV
jgi:hypothetical protein